MHRRTVLFHSSRDGALMGVEALEGRQQGRVDVDQAPIPARDEPGAQHAHEARKAHDVDAMRFEPRIELPVEGFTILAERLVVDRLGCDACLARAFASPAASGTLERTSAISAG